MAVEDHVVPDNPTNNFAVINVLAAFGYVLTNGNLEISRTGSSQSYVLSTMPVNSGKWYWEVYCKTSSSNYPRVGVHNTSVGSNEAATNYPSGNADGSTRSWAATTTGNLAGTSILGSAYIDGTNSFTAGGESGRYVTGDILRFYLDLDSSSQSISFGLNGTLTLHTFTNLPDGFWSPAIFSKQNADEWFLNAGQDSSFGGNKTSGSAAAPDANGHGDFYYAPPTGALALCTQNIPTPSIDSAVGNKPEDFFKCLTYSGTGSQQDIAVGFKPDLVWAKSRTQTYGHMLYDTVRGQKHLNSDTTDAEVSDTQLAFHATDGFTVATGSGELNDATGAPNNFAAWCWKAGGAPSGATSATGSAKRINTSGTQDDTSCSALATAAISAGASNVITPTLMSINQKSGFSIITYSISSTTDANDFTIPHGLNKAPEFIIVKNTVQPGHTGSQMWCVYHHSEPSKTGFLNRTLAFTTQENTNNFNGTVPTSQVFTVGHPSNNNSGDTCRDGNSYVAYCWHSVPGYSAFGSYTGNGTSAGPFVYTGFRPSFVMIKNTSATADWIIIDPARDEFNSTTGHALYPSLNFAEANLAAYALDLLSNGFKIRNNGSEMNRNGNTDTFIYMAFAEQPINYANAR